MEATSRRGVGWAIIEYFFLQHGRTLNRRVTSINDNRGLMTGRWGDPRQLKSEIQIDLNQK